MFRGFLKFFKRRPAPLLIALALLLGACSPMYVLRAGWEESRILWKRRPIDKLVRRSDMPQEQKAKFRLVLAARDFAQKMGLEPEGSFTEYTDVEREVLLWVLSASSATEFRPVTWWFPIVGSIPYKGFFDKEQAWEEAGELQQEGYDIYLRPSPAFSTLGWFDDPLLSTVLAFDDVSLVGTVIHEILHNTIWIKNSAPFNETLANFVGTIGARNFFLAQDPPLLKLAEEADARWHDELLFAEFLRRIRSELEELYARASKTPDGEGLGREEILKRREIKFEEIRSEWQALQSSFRSQTYRGANISLNNASIVAYEIYLSKPQLFSRHYAACGDNLPRFIASLRLFADSKAAKKGPFDGLQQTAERCLAD